MTNNLDPNLIKTLEQLRDIHYPEVSLWWPPAPGICILLILVIILLISLAIKYYYSRPSQKAIKELSLIQKLLETNNIDKITAVQKINILLRTSAISRSKNNTDNTNNTNNIASLTGSKWLNFLNKTGYTKEFTDNDISILINKLAYQNPVNIKNTDKYNINNLINLTKKWIKINL